MSKSKKSDKPYTPPTKSPYEPQKLPPLKRKWRSLNPYTGKVIEHEIIDK